MLFFFSFISFSLAGDYFFFLFQANDLRVGLTWQAKSTYKTENMKLLPRFSRVFLFVMHAVGYRWKGSMFLASFFVCYSFKSFVDARRQWFISLCKWTMYSQSHLINLGCLFGRQKGFIWPKEWRRLVARTRFFSLILFIYITNIIYLA